MSLLGSPYAHGVPGTPHIEVRNIADQFVCLEVLVRDEDIVITLLESLPTSYEYLIIALKNDVYEGAYNKLCEDAFDVLEVKTQEEGTPRWKCRHGIVTIQNEQLIFTPRYKVVFLLQQTGPHYAFYYKTKNKERENEKNAKNNDEYAFVMYNGTYSKSVFKWIMNL